jgi:hypothetical protein
MFQKKISSVLLALGNSKDVNYFNISRGERDIFHIKPIALCKIQIFQNSYIVFIIEDIESRGKTMWHHKIILLCDITLCFHIVIVIRCCLVSTPE